MAVALIMERQEFDLARIEIGVVKKRRGKKIRSDIEVIIIDIKIINSVRLKIIIAKIIIIIIK